MTSIIDRLTGMFNSAVDGVMHALPRIVLGVVLVVVALFVAKLVRRGLEAALRKMEVDAAMERVGLDKASRKLGVSELSTTIPKIIYGLLLFVFAGVAADAVGLQSVASAIGGVLDYLPNVAAALLLISFGLWAAEVVGGTIERASLENGVEFGPSLARVVSAAIIFVCGLTAVGQLKIDTEIVRIVTVCGLGALGLSFGLSVGLGSRDIVRNILAGFYARKVFRGGDALEVRGHRGTLRGITATQSIIEGEDHTLVVPNSVFLDESVALYETEGEAIDE